ncbi:hypothetical protein, partial [Streptomyces sp. NPDC001480]|uniref:hypothetical protein n=1 Tax=Streptomyces sp. NPDC001480 TaxID=3364577 RepID=UPI0036CA2E72
MAELFAALPMAPPARAGEAGRMPRAGHPQPLLTRPRGSSDEVGLPGPGHIARKGMTKARRLRGRAWRSLSRHCRRRRRRGPG